MADNNLTPKEEFLLNPVEEHNIENAPLATFETNLKAPVKVTVPFSSVQDLHGMPNPYPAGASVNLIPDGTDTSNGYVAGQHLNADGTTTTIANWYISEYITLDAETTYTWSNRVNTNVAPSICFYDENKDFLSGVNINSQYSYTFTPPEGAVYCRSSQTTYAYQKESASNGAFQLEVGSTATAYRRYSNVCPINGCDGCNIKFAPRNILDNYSPLTYSEQGWGLYVNYNSGSQVNTYGDCMAILTYIDCSKLLGQKIWLNYRPASSSREHESRTSGFFFYDENKNPISGIANGSNDGGPWEITVPNNSQIKYMRLSFQGTKKNDLRLFKSSDMKNYPISWGNEHGTQYGGYITLNEDGSADLISLWATITLNGTSSINTFPWGGKSGVWARALFNKPSGYKSIASGASIDSSLSGSDCLRFYSNIANKCPTYWALGYYSVVNRYGPAIGVDTSITGSTKAELSAWLDENPINICYRLETPITHHFPNVGQLKAFLGQNNVWSDLGNVNVKYLTQHSETGVEWRRDRALELHRRVMIANGPKLHTAVGSSETGGIANFKAYIKSPVKSVTVPFYPKQDLHGYANPWPAGGWKNLFDVNNVNQLDCWIDGQGKISFSSNDKVIWVKCNPNTTYTISKSVIANSETAFAMGSTNVLPKNGITLENYIRYMRIDASRISASITTGEDHEYLCLWCYDSTKTGDAQLGYETILNSIQIELGSTATAYAPYENICPIEGWAGCDVTNTGYNLLDLGVAEATPGALIDGKRILEPYKYYPGFHGSSFNYYYRGFVTDFSVDGQSCSFTLSQYTVGITFCVKGGTRIRGSITGTNVEVGCIDFFDKDWNYIRGSWGLKNGENVPSNATYALARIQSVTVGQPSTVTNYTIAYETESVDPQLFEGTSIPITFSRSGDHEFLPYQEGSGDPSPDNVRPIQPGLSFVRDDNSTLDVYGGTLTVNENGTGTIVSTYYHCIYDGVNKKANSSYLNDTYVQAGDVYCVPDGPVGSEARVLCDKLSPTNPYASASMCQLGYPPAGALYFVFRIRLVDGSGVTNASECISYVNGWFQENPTTVVYKTKEASYQTYTLSASETNRALEALGLTQHIGPIYGGTVTINPDGSADVVADKAGYDMGSLTWGTFYQQSLFNTTFNDMPIIMSQQFDGWIYCSCFKPMYGTSLGTIGTNCRNNQIMGRNTYRELYIRDTRFTDAADFKAAVAGQTLVVPLENPVSYHFDNVGQLKVWLGENNFWCDISDDITVKYWNRG